MNGPHEVAARTEVRDGMRITWHQPIDMDDGLVLRADVYRPVTHNDPDDRPPEVFGGRVTLHAGGARESYLLLPIIPSHGA